ncbi:MAG: YifB family Mg chelatase-like AAA ATPase [Alphaproteobacteria bacterium]|nr:YifB family Mg chelatase-like AAA ATPase [Alphaproteobacteria bacterium]
MTAHVTTFTFEGVETTPVDVQVQLTSGLPAFVLVGLPDKAVSESRERVRAAIGALGLSLPAKRIVVNLAPADLVKEGSHYDLPIAIGLLVAMGVIPQDAVAEFAALGEVSLDGRLLPVAGVLPAAIGANAMGKGLICPAANGPEALWAGELTVLAPESLLALINHVKGTQLIPEPKRQELSSPIRYTDMKQVRGQHVARRALEIAASGGHNMLMVGPPGSGKSLLASCLPGILPPLDAREMLDVSIVASIAGKLVDGALSRERPFRDPHHSASLAAMVGGGRRAVPGEISLAHQGVLFLDELPEFPRGVLESLRQPIETGRVSVARVQSHVTFPAEFQLVTAMNPCRCGYLADVARACGRAPKCAVDYQSRISGPLLDRIDLSVDVPQQDSFEAMQLPAGESTEAVAARVASARERQKQRLARLFPKEPIRINARLDGDALHAVATPDAEGMNILKSAAEKFGLSMRSYSRVLKVARTIADMEESEDVRAPHISEALAYRMMHYGK